MLFYSKEAALLVYDQVNRDNPDLVVELTPAIAALTSGPTTVSLNGRNTKAVFTGYPGSGLQGNVTLYYDRINLAQLFNFVPLIGIDATGPAGVNLIGLTPTNQKRVIDFKGQKYMVRLMRGWGDEDLSTFVSTQMTSNDHDVTANAKNNEFNDFIYSLCSFVPLRQRTENFAENILDKWLNTPYNAGYNSDGQARESNRGRIMCQERQNPGSGVATPVLIRGVRVTAYSSWPSYAKGNLSYCAMMGGTQELMWVPVLELIEDGVTL